VSKLEQAPPPSPEGVPARPPSKPSRAALYIWIGIAVFCLVMFGSALGLFLWSRDAFSSRDLKRAKSVKITYVVKGNVKKTVVVDKPAELASLLDSLEITNTQMGWSQGIQQNQGFIDFTLSNGTNARVAFMNGQPTQLDRVDWGWVYVTSAFHRKVNEIISKEEGREIDILKPGN
jgi:hypothetical protein